MDSSEVYTVGLSNYVGSNGSHDLVSGENEPSNGIFFANREVRFRDIVDGLSNTIMLGERAWVDRDSGGWDFRAANGFVARGIQERSFVGLADVLAAGRYRMNFNANKQGDGLQASYARRAFSSNHGGGAQFLFADGAVIFLSDTVDADLDQETQLTRTPEPDSIWEQGLSRNDGAVGDLIFDF